MATVDESRVQDTSDPRQGPKSDNNLLRLVQGYLKSWIDGTEEWRQLAKQDLNFTNGHQWEQGDRQYVLNQNREALTFNEIRPQVELLAGQQRFSTTDFTTTPRNREDQRLSTIASGVLKAGFEFAGVGPQSDKVFDDGTVTGLGAWEIGHVLDNAEDLVWGDVFVERKPSLSFIWDPWAIPPSYQDGRFMGKAWWMDEDTFKATYPDVNLPARGEWLSRFKESFGDISDSGTGASLLKELVEADKGHIRVVRLYYKTPKKLHFIINEITGEAMDGGSSKAKAQKVLKDFISDQVELKMGTQLPVSVPGPDGSPVWVVMNENQQAQVDPQTGEPLQFQSEEAAQSQIDISKSQLEGVLRDQHKIMMRDIKVVNWVEMIAWQIIKKGSHFSRKFPFAVYIQRQFGDDPKDIEGLPRQIIDRQKEVNKRHNHLADHLAHSSHSGWLNKKGDGADTNQLKLVGSSPGAIVEYNMVKPEQIQPTNISPGHVTLLSENINGIPRATGINSELLGLTSSSTVSGRAITARQRGGVTIISTRLRPFEQAQLEMAKLFLDQIQESWPVEKILRVIGVFESQSGQDQFGQSLFKDPVTGEPATDTQIISMLKEFKQTQYDISIKAAPADQSERQIQFERAVELMNLVAATGRQPGVASMNELTEMADMPEKLRIAIKQDLQQEVDLAQAAAAGGNPAEAFQNAVANIRNTRQGGSP